MGRTETPGTIDITKRHKLFSRWMNWAWLKTFPSVKRTVMLFYGTDFPICFKANLLTRFCWRVF